MKPRVSFSVYKDADFGEKGWAYLISIDGRRTRTLETGHTDDHDKDGSIAFARDLAKSWRASLPDVGKYIHVEGDFRTYRGVRIIFSETGQVQPGSFKAYHWYIEESVSIGFNISHVTRRYFETIADAKRFINNVINNKS